MQDNRWNRLLLSVLLTAAVGLITIDYRDSSARPMRDLRHAGASVFSTAEGISSGVTAPLGGIFGTLSGGQQARLQILLLELAGSTLLLLDEPTDNLDLPSAEALQQGLESYQGTVLAVTHDRWFARSFERFLIFTPDGNVREATEPAWD